MNPIKVFCSGGRGILALFLLLFCLLSTSPFINVPNNSESAQSEVYDFPDPVGVINDFENILSSEEEKELEILIENQKKKTGDQMVIVTLDSIPESYTFFEYTLDLANYWGVGERNKNNGILIALSEAMRKVRIQNGYGIEERLTDWETKLVIDSLMIPEFKKGEHFNGLKAGLIGIGKEL